MVSAYELYLFLHVLGVVVWLGGAAALQAFALLATRSGDPVRVASFAKDAEWVGFRVFMPSSLLLLIFGFALVAEGNWSLGDFWLSFGLAVFIASFLAGIGYFGPESGRIAKLTEAHGVAHPEVQARIKRIFLISRIELLFLLAVLFDMIAKPFL